MFFLPEIALLITQPLELWHQAALQILWFGQRKGFLPLQNLTFDVDKY